MDTQAMTFGGKSTPEDIEAQRDRIPAAIPNKINLISDALKKELSEIICIKRSANCKSKLIG